MVNLAKFVVGTTRMEAVSVRGKLHTVTLTKVSKDVWLADGDYDGKKIQTKGSDGISALSRWQITARGKKPRPVTHER